MRSLVLFSTILFLLSPFYALGNCQKYENALKMMDYRNLKNKGELPTYKIDINQARSYVYNTPLFNDLGFGKLAGGKGWKRYKATMNSSKLKDKFVGWEKTIPGHGHARVRIDLPDGNAKKAHYNIEINVKSGINKGKYKLAVEFDCGGVCTTEQILKYVERYQ